MCNAVALHDLGHTGGIAPVPIGQHQSGLHGRGSDGDKGHGSRCHLRQMLARDGTRRLLGGRAPGFDCVVDLVDWRALVRLAMGGSAGWYRAWAAGEWRSADPVPLFALFMANAVSLGRVARPHGPARWAGRLLHWARRNNRNGSRRNIAYHYDLGNDFYSL